MEDDACEDSVAAGSCLYTQDKLSVADFLALTTQGHFGQRRSDSPETSTKAAEITENVISPSNPTDPVTHVQNLVDIISNVLTPSFLTEDLINRIKEMENNIGQSDNVKEILFYLEANDWFVEDATMQWLNDIPRRQKRPIRHVNQADGEDINKDNVGDQACDGNEDKGNNNKPRGVYSAKWHSLEATYLRNRFAMTPYVSSHGLQDRLVADFNKVFFNLYLPDNVKPCHVRSMAAMSCYIHRILLPKYAARRAGDWSESNKTRHMRAKKAIIELRSQEESDFWERHVGVVDSIEV